MRTGLLQIRRCGGRTFIVSYFILIKIECWRDNCFREATGTRLGSRELPQMSARFHLAIPGSNRGPSTCRGLGERHQGESIPAGASGVGAISGSRNDAVQSEQRPHATRSRRSANRSKTVVGRPVAQGPRSRPALVFSTVAVVGRDCSPKTHTTPFHTTVVVCNKDSRG